MENNGHDIQQIPVIFRVLLAHVALSFLHILMFNMGHPLFGVLSPYPLWVQLIVLSVLNFGLYLILSILIAHSKDDVSTFYIKYDRALIIFWLILFVVYGALFLISLWRPVRNFWLIYSLVNPVFGTFMYRLPDVQFYSIWWIVSTFIPPIAMFFGALIRMKFEVKKV